jgi:opacity protein-like surface antigen
MRRSLLFILLSAAIFLNAQSYHKNDITLNCNIGTPHLFKGIVKLAVHSRVFKENFDGILEVSSITGLNPLVFKGEYGINKMFGLGINYSVWKIKFDVTDHYNAQNQSAAFYKDSVDIYKITVASKSFGIRPNFHFPLKSPRNDLYIGIGLGFTKNNLNIDFGSTDAGRFIKTFGRGLEYDLSLPGGFYIAPSIGYRHYFNKFLGLNFEVGYEKGAILQGGIVLRFNPEKEVRDTE